MSHRGRQDPEFREPTQPDPRDQWITLLDDGSFLIEFGMGEFSGCRFHGYDVRVVDGRRQRCLAGSVEARYRIFVSATGKRLVTELSYPAAHALTFLEVEQQLYEAAPMQR
jgi:hypothetical protein